VERFHGERRVAAREFEAVAVGAACRGQGIYDGLQPERMSRGVIDQTGVDMASAADAVAVDGFYVGRSGGNAGAFDAVAEDDDGLVGIVGLRDVFAIGRRAAGQIVGLLPSDFVDTHRQSTLGAFGSWR